VGVVADKQECCPRRDSDSSQDWRRQYSIMTPTAIHVATAAIADVRFSMELSADEQLVDCTQAIWHDAQNVFRRGTSSMNPDSALWRGAKENEYVRRRNSRSLRLENVTACCVWL